ncbi:MAG: hypothetical protein V4534_00685 [Myxococcota bacterium]
MRSRYLLALTLTLHFAAQGQGNATKPFKSCYRAEAEHQNLGTSTTWSLLVYVLGFRVVPPIVKILQKRFEPIEGEEMSCCRSGIVDGLNTANTVPTGLISAAHVLSFVSFLVTPYYYRASLQAEAECQHDKDDFQAPDATKPTECYVAEADKDILGFVIGYTSGLWLGVYIVMPAIISTLRGWIKARQSAVDPAPDAAESIQMPQSPHRATWGEAFSEGLKESEMVGANYALFNVAQLTAIGFGILPLLAFDEKFRDEQTCEYESAMRRYNASRLP